MKLTGRIWNILTGDVNMSDNEPVRLPEVMVFAGPNGSGKSTITRMAKITGDYINIERLTGIQVYVDRVKYQK